MTSIIDEFRGAYDFLSNFYEAPCVLDGIVYPTVEHAFQAAKSLSALEREVIRRADSPGMAKRLGRRVALRDDWEEVKVSVMAELLRSKFSDVVLKERLLETHGISIIEGNNWGDKFWGMVDGEGENTLGHLLMSLCNRLYEQDQLLAEFREVVE